VARLEARFRLTRRDRSNIAVARFWTCHAGSRRSVPTAFNVGRAM
jgi:hypothetical protein